MRQNSKLPLNCKQNCEFQSSGRPAIQNLAVVFLRRIFGDHGNTLVLNLFKNNTNIQLATLILSEYTSIFKRKKLKLVIHIRQSFRVHDFLKGRESKKVHNPSSLFLNWNIL